MEALCAKIETYIYKINEIVLGYQMTASGRRFFLSDIKPHDIHPEPMEALILVIVI